MKNLESLIKESAQGNASAECGIHAFIKRIIPGPGEYVNIKGFDGRVLRVAWLTPPWDTRPGVLGAIDRAAPRPPASPGATNADPAGVHPIRAWLEAHKAAHGCWPTDDEVLEAAHQDPPFSIAL